MLGWYPEISPVFCVGEPVGWDALIPQSGLDPPRESLATRMKLSLAPVDDDKLESKENLNLSTG